MLNSIFESEKDPGEDAVLDVLTDKANYVHSLHSASCCSPSLAAHHPLFKSPTLTFKDDPWVRATDHMHFRCVSKAFYYAAELLAGIADEKRRIAISEMAMPSNVRKLLIEWGYDPQANSFYKHVHKHTKIITEWQKTLPSSFKDWQRRRPFARQR